MLTTTTDNQPQPRETPVRSVPWTIATLPVPCDRVEGQPLYRRFSDNDVQAMACLVWFQVDLSPPDNAYVEVDFSPSVKEDDNLKTVATVFWQHVLSDRDYAELSRCLGGRAITTLKRRVFVTRGWAFHGGKWIQDLCASNGYAGLSLFVQSFGGRNSVPCNWCEARAYSLLDQETGVWSCEPYFECVSLPGSAGKHGVCGNCIYNQTGWGCTYNERSQRKAFGFGQKKEDGDLRQSGEVDGIGIVPSAIPQTIKRLRPYWFSFEPFENAFKDQTKMVASNPRYWPKPGPLLFAHQFLRKELFTDHRRTRFEVIPHRVRLLELELA